MKYDVRTNKKNGINEHSFTQLMILVGKKLRGVAERKRNKCKPVIDGVGLDEHERGAGKVNRLRQAAR